VSFFVPATIKPEIGGWASFAPLGDVAAELLFWDEWTNSKTFDNLTPNGSLVLCQPGTVTTRGSIMQPPSPFFYTLKFEQD
jgi:hypothetical protein